MQMFESFLSSLPINRAEMVNELEIPDITLSPYIWEPEEPPSRWPEPELSDSVEEGSLSSDSGIPLSRAMTDSEIDYDRYKRLSASVEEDSLSSDSSIPLSRALTDSEIEYDRYKRYKRMNLTDPWDAMKNAMAMLPPDHLTSLSSLPSYTTDVLDSVYDPQPRNEELRLRMERFFDDCRVFEPDDPGFLELEEALLSLDLESLYAGLDPYFP